MLANTSWRGIIFTNGQIQGLSPEELVNWCLLFYLYLPVYLCLTLKCLFKSVRLEVLFFDHQNVHSNYVTCPKCFTSPAHVWRSGYWLMSCHHCYGNMWMFLWDFVDLNLLSESITRTDCTCETLQLWGWNTLVLWWLSFFCYVFFIFIFFCTLPSSYRTYTLKHWLMIW